MYIICFQIRLATQTYRIRRLKKPKELALQKCILVSKQAAFQHLSRENLSKEKTKYIVFDHFEMRKYLFINRTPSLSKIMFAVWSGTLEMNELTPWKQGDNMCVKCESATETISHFVSCKSYSIDTLANDWANIYQDNPDIQYDIARK